MDTEQHYLTYDPQAIWDEMILAYYEAGGDVLYGGDEKEILLRGVQAISVQQLSGVDNALRMNTLRYAVGEYLKIYGEKRNCEYIEATKATGSVTITFLESRKARTIAAGTTMTADGARFYELTEDVEQTGYAQVVTVGVRCVDAGAIGNGLTAGTAMQFTELNPAVASILVAAATAGGADAEDEEVYRERIRLSGLASVTTGPQSQYEAAAKAVSSAIIDASAMRLSAGVVGVYLLLDDGADEAAMIAAVQAALTPTDRRPLTDLVTVAIAQQKAYTLNVGYQVAADADSQTLTAIQAAAEEYAAWQDRVIGRPFNPDRLIALMYQAGATRVVFEEGSVFDGGAVAYTEIGDDTRVEGEISLAVMAT